ncbi:SLC13 family permease [Rhodobacter capsulatus]|uniref:SLC13 family permease n=1 Tax=Rhodobacter capsulatus TaxID=1061 RepID=UPI001141D726|nr:SLC13 family permease [Rhodobacter capsulatus]TQD38287.1 SLC13 family permease [Rhodobacter capsulatus]
MTQPQILLFTIFAAVVAAMVHGRLRPDLVAFAGLLAGVLAGVVPAETAFSGFAHPAVMTVALVLVVSAGLTRTGAISALARLLSNPALPVSLHVARLGVVGGLLSSVMNNVTALALLMPVDIATARKARRAAGLTLMPLAFATVLGGLVTLIGTPPNLIISGLREGHSGAGFGFFDFLPVGGIVAVAGILFLALFGWRLLPRRDTGGDASAPPEALMRGYLAELVVPEKARVLGRSRADLAALCEGCEATLVAIQRRGRRVHGPDRRVTLELGDILLIEAVPTRLEELRLEMGLAYPDGLSADAPRIAGTGEEMVEMVVGAGSRLRGRSARQARLAQDHDAVLLGILRQGRMLRARPRDTALATGDILLLLLPEGRAEALAAPLRLLPLDGRETVMQEGRAVLAAGLFAAAILAASLGLTSMPVALGGVVVGYLMAGILNLDTLYDSIDGPVIVLLAALTPLGAAIDSTGGSALLAGWLGAATAGLPAWVGLAVLMVATMTVSDLLNNNATAIIAAPVGLRLAEATQTNPDAYLMAVALGASCAFLTPIGHQNNTLVMGPGGYRFGDYWRIGLPLEVVCLAVGLPAILIFWPL